MCKWMLSNTHTHSDTNTHACKNATTIRGVFASKSRGGPFRGGVSKQQLVLCAASLMDFRCGETLLFLTDPFNTHTETHTHTHTYTHTHSPATPPAIEPPLTKYNTHTHTHIHQIE